MAGNIKKGRNEYFCIKHLGQNQLNQYFEEMAKQLLFTPGETVEWLGT
jgi:hypothetical protein